MKLHRCAVALAYVLVILGSSGCFSYSLYESTIDDDRWPTARRYDVMGISAATVTSTAQGLTVTDVRVYVRSDGFWREDLRTGTSVRETPPPGGERPLPPLPPGLAFLHVPPGAREMVLDDGTHYRFGPAGLKLAPAPDPDAVRAVPAIAEYADPSKGEAWLDIYGRPGDRTLEERPSPYGPGMRYRVARLEPPQRVPIPPPATPTAGDHAADVGRAALFVVVVPITAALDIVTAPVQVILVIARGKSLGGL